MAFNYTSYQSPTQPRPTLADMQKPMQPGPGNPTLQAPMAPSIPVTGGVNNAFGPAQMPPAPMPPMNPGGQMMPQQAQAMMPQFGNQPGPPKLGNNANAMGRQKMLSAQLRKQFAGPAMGGGGATLPTADPYSGGGAGGFAPLAPTTYR